MARAGPAGGFFEIWFAVVFEREGSRAWWLRWTTFASGAGETRGTIWAAAFERGRRACAGKAFVAVDDVRAGAAALARGASAGRVDTDGGPLAWELAFGGAPAGARARVARAPARRRGSRTSAPKRA